MRCAAGILVALLAGCGAIPCRWQREVPRVYAAFAAEASGEAETARRELRGVRGPARRSVAVLLLRARLRMANGRAPTALLRRALRRAEGAADALTAVGALWARWDVVRGRRVLLQAAFAAPRDWRPAWHLAAVARAAGDRSAARMWLRAAAYRGDGTVAFHRHMAWLWDAVGAHGQALEHKRALLRFDAAVHLGW